jgi:hypothetical protein
MGIGKKLADKARKLAALPADEFERRVENPPPQLHV